MKFNENRIPDATLFKTYEFDISDINRTDINSLIWFVFESENNLAPGRGGYNWFQHDIASIYFTK